MWYVMSYNSIEGYNNGAFEDLDMLFLGPDDGEEDKNWVPLITEAQAFETEEKAREYVSTVWGSWGLRAMCFVHYDKAYDLVKSADLRKRINARRTFVRSLASTTITAEALKQMAQDKGFYNNAMTYREKWIIDILTRED